MNVLYYNCYADPWINVAHKLQQTNNYKPVYWVGYEDDNSDDLIPINFPDCIYHDYYDAWKGVFPDQIKDVIKNSYLDIDFLKQNAQFELQAIKNDGSYGSGWQKF